MRDRQGVEVKVTGAGVPGTMGDDNKKANDSDEVTLPTFDPNFFTHPEGHPREWVIVRDTGQPNEQKQPFVSLNGYAVKFQKNVPIHLPVPIINMMKNCIFTKIERDPDTGEESPRDIPRFSIERLDHAPDGIDPNTP